MSIAIYLASIVSERFCGLSSSHNFMLLATDLSLKRLQRLIFVPQGGSDDESSSGSDDSGANRPMQGDDGSSSSSSDDNDSTDAAHAAAIGHSPLPPGNSNVVTAPVGATAAVAAGAGVEESNGDVDASTSKEDKRESAETSEADKGEQAEGLTKDNAAQQEATSTFDSGGVPASPANESTLGNDQASVEQTSPSAPMDTSPDKPIAQDEEMESPEKEVTSTPRISVVIPASEAAKMSKEFDKKASKKSKKVTYYCPYDLNERDPDEITPLHVAILARKLGCVKLLLEAGASVHKKNDGSAPIHTAISVGAVPAHATFAYECAVVLASFDADLSVKDDSMHTPLYLACAANLPHVVSLILNDSVGLSTLNARADRSGARALHAAAKFESLQTPAATVPGNRPRPAGGHHHPDGSILSGKRIPELQATSGKFGSVNSQAGRGSSSSDSPALVTQLLLSTPGIEIDAQNSVGQTPLHVACSRGNWPVVRLLLVAGASPSINDKRGMTPGQVALKRGMPVPNDLLSSLGDPASPTNGAPPRDLIVDPDSPTLLICHELCNLHRTCPPIRRESLSDVPPENVRRLHVLLNENTGILRGGEFGRVVWDSNARRASMVDVLKVRTCFLCAFSLNEEELILLTPSYFVDMMNRFMTIRTSKRLAEYVIQYQTTRRLWLTWTGIPVFHAGALRLRYVLLVVSVMRSTRSSLAISETRSALYVLQDITQVQEAL